MTELTKLRNIERKEKKKYPRNIVAIAKNIDKMRSIIKKSKINAAKDFERVC